MGACLVVAEAADAGLQSKTSEDRDRAQIRAVFDRYKAALVGGDGVAAAAHVDRETLEYFSELKALASSADRAQIDQRPFIDRLLVVSIRHVVESAEIEAMDLADLIERAVDEGWISPATIQQLAMGEIVLDGDQASGEVLTAASLASDSGGAGTASPVDGLVYRFRREEGTWKFGFSSLVAGLNRVIGEFTRQLGTDEDELIFVLVEAFSGKKVLPEVWQPPER